jgi:hypothetical protein
MLGKPLVVDSIDKVKTGGSSEAKWIRPLD